jgi:DNA invertase Pin-like site-specific DNA recombinase
LATVANDEQASDGISLKVQRHKLDLYAQLHRLELVSVEIDAGESGKSLDRPGLTRALAALEAGQAEALVIVKLVRRGETRAAGPALRTRGSIPSVRRREHSKELPPTRSQGDE